MNIDHISEQKEIIDFVKDIKDLTDQQKNPTRDGMENVILNIKNKYKIETEVFERSTAVATNGIMTDIKNISNDVTIENAKERKWYPCQFSFAAVPATSVPMRFISSWRKARTSSSSTTSRPAIAGR